eukprot:scaffold1184_cov97-Skeletonema_marinoi.AAC.2
MKKYWSARSGCAAVKGIYAMQALHACDTLQGQEEARRQRSPDFWLIGSYLSSSRPPGFLPAKIFTDSYAPWCPPLLRPTLRTNTKDINITEIFPTLVPSATCQWRRSFAGGTITEKLLSLSAAENLSLLATSTPIMVILGMLNVILKAHIALNGVI